MAQTLIFTFLVLFGMLCQYTDAASINIEAQPYVILPVLSKKLNMRCSIQNSTAKSPLLTTLMPPTTQMTSASSTQIAGPVSAGQGSDVSHLLSLVITKFNAVTGENETLASVAGCLAAAPEVNFLGKVTVDGNTDWSPVTGEVAYLQVTWEMPLSEHSGTYYCEASALTSEKHSISISASLQIVTKDPTISDLVTYISEHDKNISSLSAQMLALKLEKEALKLELETMKSNLTAQMSDIETRVASISGHNIQTGSTSCSYQYVTFPVAFNSTPTVFTSMGSLYMSGYSSYSSASYQISTSSVTNESFYLSCSISGAFSSSTSINWLAIV
ncbi:uncharacterized protein LOC131945082 [Physella acuta]|uniref:uncharacterized protein LOC131945082 n=1 Tax=Physella acuta TaxID=109671 RepID=UPI0027DD92C8|nr:uncharacterized protein LOC131945082 [Physella acuta]